MFTKCLQIITYNPKITLNSVIFENVKSLFKLKEKVKQNNEPNQPRRVKKQIRQ